MNLSGIYHLVLAVFYMIFLVSLVVMHYRLPFDFVQAQAVQERKNTFPPGDLLLRDLSRDLPAYIAKMKLQQQKTA